MKTLSRIEFGNAILRQVAKQLTPEEIKSPEIQTLIENMRHTLVSMKLGVGLAAPQVGQGVALSVIAIHPTEHRPKVVPFEQVIINPEITHTFGPQQHMWEGCLSAGSSGLFAKVLRHEKIEAHYLDEQGVQHTETLEGLPAQVFQHEVDHLNGILFVDHVTDPTTYMTLKEYRKQISKRT